MSITFVRDATHRNVNSLPPGILAALYTTGSPDIKATPDDFAKHPNAIRICQDHGSDDTADILDVEDFAATPADTAIWVPKARHSFMTNKRPGQRWPGCYMPRSLITPVANALTNAGITDVPLWIAHPGMPQTDAIAEIAAAAGPFPIIAFQIRFDTTTDLDVVSTQWLNKRSGVVMATKAQMPPGPWNDAHAWDWKEVVTAGIGLDGKLHMFAFDPAKGTWTKTL